ncbi:hypothetical protein [Methylocystis sp.]|uniref:hypothetical protein n=1 Tax=Methylocystis sp. TaxID=1911079 RepID=UPI003DA26D2A
MLTDVGIVAAFISLGIAAYAGRRNGGSAIFYIMLAIYHMLFCFIFYNETLYTTSDANYYYDFGAFIGEGPLISASLIIEMATVFREALGATFLDEFFIFQIFGLIGIILILKTMGIVGAGFSERQKLIFPIVAFSPALNFFTVAIGKDAPFLMALGLICRGLSRSGKQYPYVITGLAIAFLVRPHIGILYAVSVIATTFFSARVALGARVIVLVSGAICTLFASMFFLSWMGIEEVNSESLAGTIDKFGTANNAAGSAINLEGLIFPARVAAFLFLPFFFDASSVTAIILSIDNLIILCLFIYCVYNIRLLWSVSARLWTVPFGVIMFTIVTIMLTYTCTNSGLAARQKLMVTPILPILYCVANAASNPRRAPVPKGRLQELVPGATERPRHRAPATLSTFSAGADLFRRRKT